MAKKAKILRPSTTHLVKKVDQVCEDRLDYGAEKYGDFDWEGMEASDLLDAAAPDWENVKMGCISPGIRTTAEQVKEACADLINRLRMVYGKLDGIDRELRSKRSR